MNVITFRTGYIVAENEEIERYLIELFEKDMLWDHISRLITEDYYGPKEKREQEASANPEVENRLASIEDQLKTLNLTSIEDQLKILNSTLKSNPSSVQVMQVQTPASEEPAPAKPVQPKKVKKTKVSGKGSKGFLAAAQKASSFR